MAKQTLTQKADSFHVNVEVLLFEEHGSFVAYCPALELSSYGDDKNDAKNAFEEALKIFIDDTSKKGTLEKFLLKLGWQLQQKPKANYQPPQFLLRDHQVLLHKNPSVYQERMAMPV